MVVRQVLLLSIFSAVMAKKKKTCEGMFDKESYVKNLCHNTFPKDTDDKIWLIKFYAPYGKSKAFKSDFEELAEELELDNLEVGAIDCSKGKNVDFCRRNANVGNTFPSILALHAGKQTKFRKMVNKEAVKDFIVNVHAKIGTKGGSAKCPKGVFTSTLKDPVVPLCAEHYPSEASKNSWVVVFYANDFDKQVISRVSLDLGNEPIDKSKALKKPMAQRKRLKNLREKYELPVGELKKGELTTMDPLAKVGAVCCDCDNNKYKSFCLEKVGDFENEKFVFINGPTVVTLEGSSANVLVSQILQQLGHLKDKTEL